MKWQAVLFAGVLVGFFVWSGCQPSQQGFQKVEVLLPANFMTGRHWEWSVLDSKARMKLLGERMPAVSEKTRGKSIDQVIEETWGRRVVYVPRQSSEDAVGVLYDNEFAKNDPAKMPTLGEYLEGFLNGSQMFGGPIRRFRQQYPEVEDTNAIAYAALDVLIITEKHIVVVAVPRE